MSIRAMTLVWDSGAYEGGTLLVLLAMADWANDDGSKVHPRMETLAEKARLSVRGAQLCVARLKRDGVIVETNPARRGRAPEYKIVLERVKELHRNDCTATVSGEAEGDNGVQSEAVGVKSDVSHIENHQEPSDDPPYAREDALSRWAEVWAAFLTWQNMPDTATEARAKGAVERLLDQLPAAPDLIARILAQGERLRAGNARRGRFLGSQPSTAPHNWLERDRGWESITVPTVAKADIAALRAMWNGAGGKLFDALGDPTGMQFQAWFADAKFEDGPVPRLCWPGRFKKNWVAEHFAKPLRKAFGEYQLEVAQ